MLQTLCGFNLYLCQIGRTVISLIPTTLPWSAWTRAWHWADCSCLVIRMPR
jgi:hypothetical protein